MRAAGTDFHGQKRSNDNGDEAVLLSQTRDFFNSLLEYATKADINAKGALFDLGCLSLGHLFR